MIEIFGFRCLRHLNKRHLITDCRLFHRAFRRILSLSLLWFCGRDWDNTLCKLFGHTTYDQYVRIQLLSWLFQSDGSSWSKDLLSNTWHLCAHTGLSSSCFYGVYACVWFSQLFGAFLVLKHMSSFVVEIEAGPMRVIDFEHFANCAFEFPFVIRKYRLWLGLLQWWTVVITWERLDLTLWLGSFVISKRAV